jgi:hypothetical protein
MQVLQMAGELTIRVQELTFCISLVVTGLFLHEYKRYEQEQKKQDMLDRFLSD